MTAKMRLSCLVVLPIGRWPDFLAATLFLWLVAVKMHILTPGRADWKVIWGDFFDKIAAAAVAVARLVVSARFLCLALLELGRSPVSLVRPRQ